MEILLETLGTTMVASSLWIVFYNWGKKTVAIFEFVDAEREFDIKKPGFYSVSIAGAGFLRDVEKVNIRLTHDGHLLAVNRYALAPRFRKEGTMGVECWGFSARSLGRYIVTLSNLEKIEAKSSMLRSKRLFESPIDHGNLRILVHESRRPIYKLISIVSLVFGIGLILIGIIEL